MPTGVFAQGSDALVWASTETGLLEPASLAGDNQPRSRGQRVGPYRIGRLIGEGGMGRVYAARDVNLGRLVALKLLRPDRVSAARVARFEVEGRLTAQFNHPNIVQVYAFGYSDDTPYLALEFLDGDPLSEWFGHQALGPAAVARMLLPVASALTEAHRRGILHRDLKPGNIVRCRDGRIRVLDFGLAALMEELAGQQPGLRVAGTPVYMAPEQWRGQNVGKGVDLWALGVMIHEGLYGQRPFASFESSQTSLSAAVTSGEPTPMQASYDGLDPRLWGLMANCLSPDPAGRPSAAVAFKMLEDLLQRPTFSDSDSPYPGLRPFRENESAYFFGREDDVARGRTQLYRAGVLVVVGPSGAGKSSMVRAGLIPRLREETRWTVVAMRPGQRPFEELARALANLGTISQLETPSQIGEVPHDTDMAHDLERAPAEAIGSLHRLANGTRGHVLLFIDQAEELLTLGCERDEASTFLGFLRDAAADIADPLRVILTVRDDFMTRLLALSPQTDWARSVLALGIPGRAQLRAAVEGPIDAHGYRFEDASVVTEMVESVADDSSGLPVLQFVCARLWRERDTHQRIIGSAAYEGIGRISGAIARHADETLSQMNESVRRAARDVLLRMVTAQHTRRPLARPILLEGLSADAAEAVDRLVGARLITVRSTDDEAEVCDLAHESLVSHWATLRSWLEEVSDDLATLREVEVASEHWRRQGRSDDALWTGDLLTETRSRIARLADSGPPIVRAFLDASTVRERRRTRLRRLLAYGSVSILLVVTAVSLVAAAAFARAEAAVRKEKDAAASQAEAMRLASADIGIFRLRLVPFDWDAKTLESRDNLSIRFTEWTLYDPNPSEPAEYGEPIATDRLTVTRDESGTTLVETRSGPAWLRVSRHFADGRPCSDSWVPLRWLPGYAQRGATPTELVLAVPTCTASLADTKRIEAGPFISQGPGEPRGNFPSYVDPEVVLDLKTFAIQRTELSNAAYSTFSAMSEVTGRPVLRYPDSGALSNAGDPKHPATGMNWWVARDYCRFIGGRLPTSNEWEKVARGGITVNGKHNPHPRRNAPWGLETAYTGRANLAGSDDYDGTAPVEALPAGDSPYGVRQLAGNVSEWTSSIPAEEPRFRVRRGGGFADPPEEEMHWLVYENMSDSHYSVFDIGFRCVLDVVEQDPTH
ncbi:MAG: serine/threonine protein kinase [Myxococcota bacterium]|jgi:serine/threonine protein kinase